MVLLLHDIHYIIDIVFSDINIKPWYRCNLQRGGGGGGLGRYQVSRQK